MMKKLFEFGLVSEERKNKPRKTILKTVDEIPAHDEVMKILVIFKYTREDIAKALAKRPIS